MNHQEFETALYHHLFDFFYDRGFEMQYEKKQFRKLVETGFQNVIFSSSQYENEHLLEVNIGLRFSPIENIAQEYLDNYVDFRSDSNTLVVSIAKMSRNKYFRYRVVNHEDLRLACEQVGEFLTETGLPFLDHHQHVGQLDWLMNTAPGKPCPYLYNQTHRCFKGMVAAHLNKNPKYPQLASAYHQFLEHSGTKPDMIHSFKKLLAFLELHSEG